MRARRTEQEIREGKGEARALIRLTTQCSTVYHWLPSRLLRFQRDHPEVDVEVVAGATADPIPALLEGKIDLAIVHRPVRDRRVRQLSLSKDELVVVMHPRHRLSHAPFVAAADFAPEHLIVYSIPREANLVFRDVLIPAGVTPRRVTHIQLTEAIVELVKAGVGVSVLARWAVAPQVERGEPVARPLTRGGRYRQWSAAWRSGKAAAHVLAFAELLARQPLPLGATARERRRMALAIG
jgi:LysR family transcriptional regulator for metE and metH